LKVLRRVLEEIEGEVLREAKECKRYGLGMVRNAVLATTSARSRPVSCLTSITGKKMLTLPENNLALKFCLDYVNLIKI